MVSRTELKDKYFPLPNSIFILNLKPGEFIVYAYLMYIEDRKTFVCKVKQQTMMERCNIGSRTTLEKHLKNLEKKKLISIEHTTKKWHDNSVKNSICNYTILPIAEAEAYAIKKQFEENERRQKEAQLKLKLTEAKGTQKLKCTVDWVKLATGNTLRRYYDKLSGI